MISKLALAASLAALTLFGVTGSAMAGGYHSPGALFEFAYEIEDGFSYEVEFGSEDDEDEFAEADDGEFEDDLDEEEDEEEDEE